jgi:hypothetical protein
MLHLDPVQLEETRVITATRDGLASITVSWSVPPVPGATARPLHVELIFGGRLVQDKKSTSSYWTGEIELPEPLSSGQTHEYRVRVSTLPIGQLLPYYVLTPFRRVDTFAVRAKFDPEQLPLRVTRLDGAPFQTLGMEPPLDAAAVPLDAVGEAFATFRNLRPGLSHGLHWETPQQAG